MCHQDSGKMREIAQKSLAGFLVQSRRVALFFFSLRAVWMPPKENTEEIIDACARNFANNFLSTLRPAVKSFFFFLSLFFCSSYLTGGKLDKIHLWVRAGFVICTLRARKNTLFPFILNFQELINFYVSLKKRIQSGSLELGSYFV